MRIGLLQLSIMGLLWRYGHQTAVQLRDKLRTNYGEVKYDTVRASLRALIDREWVSSREVLPIELHGMYGARSPKMYEAEYTRQDVIDEFAAIIEEA